MKVLLNVPVSALEGHWLECEGFKLQEQNDGSFDLILTNDLARPKQIDDNFVAILGGN